MKKIFKGCSATILLFGLLLTILFFIHKSSALSDLKMKSDTINKIWISFIKKENLKNKIMINLLNSYHYKNSDSLKIYLTDNLNISEMQKCNEEFVRKEYFLNKYFFMTFSPYIENNVSIFKNKEEFEKILNIIDDQNLIIANYDSSVKDYNTFVGTFPNFIIAKSNGFKMKKYFQIKFGEENKDPKLARQETIEWIKQIEKEQGLNE